MSKLSFWRTICLACVFSALVAIGSAAGALTTLVSLDGSNGDAPLGTLVQAFDGNLYGTTNVGGANAAGTVFRITPAGKLTTLYSFCSQPGCPDGADPAAGLVLANNGNLYGTTEFGGANFAGTVFRVTTAGKLTTLYSFCSQLGCTDGTEPAAPLTQATDGNFYGTANLGGTDGFGTVFKVTSGGARTTLHSFVGTDGAFPNAGLVQATNGNFYGTTSEGGNSNNCGYGCGTVFEITAGGKLTVLHNFDSDPGAGPVAGLLQATNGSFYGTTEFGGPVDAGTVFTITGGGKLTSLYSFCALADCSDGGAPFAGLVQATNGNFYGTASAGGAIGDGEVFDITAGGRLNKLHSFDASDGAIPIGGLVQATNGNFYGTTETAGANGDGTVFSLALPGLGPFVATLPSSGKVGTGVIILGNNLNGATSVAFNGTAATFKVVSTTEIKTTVPSRATTGKVKVKTPRRALTSNVNFQVTR
jgi:uncharacterized repeat protein (TIGR03803 family)